ncbi:hypothetical protein ACFOX0_33675 [Micromonospora zhanjiangensis]|uniref:Uncharacterized protein n=2 Tax=Micromonospora zhanjiangensis TaxID=1522057 RepID=A0ABV8KXF8_9ACTN
MTAMVEQVSITDLVATANATINEHWQRPGTAWRPACGDCTDDGCPRLESAHRYLDRVRARVLAS